MTQPKPQGTQGTRSAKAATGATAGAPGVHRAQCGRPTGSQHSEGNGLATLGGKMIISAHTE